MSGLNGSPGKTVCQKWHREFESRPFRVVSQKIYPVKLKAGKNQNPTLDTLKKIAKAL